MRMSFSHQIVSVATCRLEDSDSLTSATIGSDLAIQALKSTTLNLAELGLILSDTITPIETCPAEATRVGKLLGLKVKAFDIIGANCSLALFLDTLVSFRPECLPDHILLVSANSFPKNSPSFNLLSANNSINEVNLVNGGAAVILSRKTLIPNLRSLVVVDAFYLNCNQRSKGLLQPLYGDLSFNSSEYEGALLKSEEKLRHDFSPSDDKNTIFTTSVKSLDFGLSAYETLSDLLNSDTAKEMAINMVTPGISVGRVVVRKISSL
jgi:3-oxoacyl-[acyl-carrier-protein] synthase III